MKKVIKKIKDCINCPHVGTRSNKKSEVPIWFCNKSKKIIVKRYWCDEKHSGIKIPKWCELENT